MKEVEKSSIKLFSQRTRLSFTFLIDWVKLEFVVIMVIAETSSGARPIKYLPIGIKLHYKEI